MQDAWPVLIGLGLLFVGAGFLTGFLIQRAASARRSALSREEAASLLEKARNEADLARKTAVLEAREAVLRESERFESQTRTVRAELEQRSRVADELEAQLRRDRETMDALRQTLQSERREIEATRQRLAEEESRLRQKVQEQTAQLERIAGLTLAEARRELWRNLEDELRGESARLAQRMREAAARDAQDEAKRLLLIAVQRLATEQSIESTVTVVPLPNDEMKGRIIGREGRNIRAFEMATGIDVIIDDTPEAVLLAGFDPVRRDVARIALERLITDGRIHPARIEEVVQRVTAEVEAGVREAGEKVAVEMGIHGLAPEVTDMLGRLRFRSSSGQNVLKHSIEVARIASMLAAEVGIDADVVRRAGLLHDIGKAIDQEQEGPHAQIGMEFLRRHGEGEIVCSAVGAHHGEREGDGIVSVLVSAADAISGARPGARRESLEAYVRRLQKLEEIANSFPGVERSFAIQAGREVRILVDHRVISDDGANGLATEIARKIEKQLHYPGQIKVVVIREMRVVDVAH